ncbi:MAG: tetratricopeptide repeat protein, partial [Kiritimatiellia bacterium]|nr:tetratricopeptide repeat protein [Kiritimatiellia bacterium]
AAVVAAVGLLLGCGGQIIGSFWLMVVPFAVWIARSIPRTGAVPRFIVGSLVMLGAIVAILPSIGHNYLVEKKITPVTTHFGLNIYMGNNPRSGGYGSAIPGLRTSAEEMTADSIKLAAILSGRPMTGAEANRFWMQQAGRFWIDEPGRASMLVLRKIHRVVSIRDFDDMGLGRVLPGEVRALRLGLVSFGMIWLCACLCFLLNRSVSGHKTVFWIMGLSNLGGMLITFVTARYRLPLAVLLLPAAGGAIAMLPRFLADFIATRTTGVKWPRLVIGLAGLAVALLPHNMPATKATDNLNRAIYLARAGRISEALSHAQTACALQPYSPDAGLVLGNIYVTQGNYAAALQSYERALIIQSNRVDVLFNAGLVLEQMGRKQEACGYYQKVVVLDPRHAKSWLGLALVQRELGNDKEAQVAIEKAAAIVGRHHFQIVEFNRTKNRKY